MATINQMRQERFAIFRELKRKLRPVDTELEYQERKIQQVLDRKRNVPEVSDLNEVVDGYVAMMDAQLDYLAQLEDASRVFGVEPPRQRF